MWLLKTLLQEKKFTDIFQKQSPLFYELFQTLIRKADDKSA